MGGDTQIAAEICEGEVCAVIFLVDPYAQPHEPDIQALLRVCHVHDVAIATNLSTAEAVIRRLAKSQVAHLIYNPVAGQGTGEQDLEMIRQLLRPHMSLHVHVTTAEVDPKELVSEAIAANADMVIASGVMAPFQPLPER